MLRAIIFDFNGVIADDETIHFFAFQQALAEEGLTLTKESYYGKYLGMDERTCTELLLQAVAGGSDPARADRIATRKSELFETQTRTAPPLFPGVISCVTQAAARYRLAIASGGRREQIAWALRGTPLETLFPVLIAAEDCSIGKPDPAMYRMALEKLNDLTPLPAPRIEPAGCLVIEDSLAGIRSARSAGMKVAAVATTYPPEALREAHVVLPNLATLRWEAMEALFA